MQKIKQGNTAAFDELYGRYSQRMLVYFFRMLGNNEEKAQDFLQDLFVKVIDKSYLFRAEARFSTWIFTIAHNMCKNEYRREGVNKKYQEHIATSGFETDEITDKDRRVPDAINRLQDDHKSLIILRYKFKMSTQEIAEVLNCPSGTVRSKLFYATKELSKYIKR